MLGRGDVPLDGFLISVDEFEVRFSNWVQWCNRKGLHQGRTGSIEGAYRSPQHWEAPNPRPPELNDPDALILNRAYWQLGEKARQTIKVLVFRPHWKQQWQAQKLGVHYMDLPEVLWRAKKMFENRVKLLDSKNIFL